MPIITPIQIQQTLREAGLSRTAKNDNIKELLNDAGLSPSELLDQLGSIARCGDSDAIKLRAIELGAKLNGLLSEDNIRQVPIVNIIIQDPQFSEINPILIPR